MHRTVTSYINSGNNVKQCNNNVPPGTPINTPISYPIYTYPTFYPVSANAPVATSDSSSSGYISYAIYSDSNCVTTPFFAHTYYASGLCYASKTTDGTLTYKTVNFDPNQACTTNAIISTTFYTDSTCTTKINTVSAKASDYVDTFNWCNTPTCSCSALNALNDENTNAFFGYGKIICSKTNNVAATVSAPNYYQM